MSVQQIIYEHLAGDFLAGDAFLCLQLAVTLQDSKKAAQAGLRCMDLARHLEAKQKPRDWHKAVEEIRSGTPNSAMMAEVVPDESYYIWGEAKWMIRNNQVYCWNVLNAEWQPSTMRPEQLRQDGAEVEG